MQKKAATKIALIGDICLDVFLQIPEYPIKGGDGLATKMVKESGGSVSNTAVALAHLGCEPTLFTHTGDDFWAQQVLMTLAQEGVNIDFVIKEEGESTGITFLAVTPDGERTMFTYRGANVLLQPSEITLDKFQEVSVLHLSGYGCLTPPQSEAIWKAVDLAFQQGIAITLDIGVEPAHVMGEKLLQLLPKLSLLILGEPEACSIAGTKDVPEAVKFLVDHGVKVIGLKLGKDGCCIITKQEQVKVPGFKVDVIDTTGAGDAFSAGMIFGLCQDWSLEKMGLLANAMGALAATRWGAGAALPERGEIIHFLSTRSEITNNDSLLKSVIGCL